MGGNDVTWPIYCARCTAGGLAHHYVDAPGRHEVVCAEHLKASLAWAGPSAKVTAVVQPDDVGGVQEGLFDMPEAKPRGMNRW